MHGLAFVVGVKSDSTQANQPTRETKQTGLSYTCGPSTLRYLTGELWVIASS